VPRHERPRAIVHDDEVVACQRLQPAQHGVSPPFAAEHHARLLERPRYRPHGVDVLRRRHDHHRIDTSVRREPPDRMGDQGLPAQRQQQLVDPAHAAAAARRHDDCPGSHVTLPGL
jgi:hypothetical protein